MPYDGCVDELGGTGFDGHETIIKNTQNLLPVKVAQRTICPRDLEWLLLFVSQKEWTWVNDELDLQAIDTPVQMLREQLGFDAGANLSSEKCAFPLLKGLGGVLWDNRGVLQVSAHIDNWIALNQGAQMTVTYAAVESSDEDANSSICDRDGRH